jgi:propanol-preferring alcohol dehydrogenase
MTPGHQVVGRVVAEGPDCQASLVGRRVGVAWIHSSCGACDYCRSGLENLCAEFRGCGRDADGGYAEYMTVPEPYAHPLPDALETATAAPLLCAGAVGLRAIRLCGLKDGEAVGLTGFGASGHLVLQMLGHLYPASPRYVFARNPDERAFALELGADWAGDTEDAPPSAPAAIIDTTPAWRPVLAALAALAPAGRLVINAIAKEAGDLDEWRGLDYQRHLWREKILRTVTNVTRADVRDCLKLAAEIPLAPRVRTYPLEQAAEALASIRAGGQPGAAVLTLR